MDFGEAFAILGSVFMILVALPWVIMHHVTKWKTASTITSDDEELLEELYQLARRLDERMDTVERLVAHDDPSFQPKRLTENSEVDNQQLNELDRLIAEKKGELK